MNSRVTPASKQYLPPEVLARIGRLDLRAKAVVEGVLTGMHKSPYKGNSVEFLQHREYTRGDDLRRVDWKVWGRQDRFYVKEYENETNLRLFLLVDGSASMDYIPPRFEKSPGLTKYDYAATLAASLAWLGLSQGDAVGASIFDEKFGPMFLLEQVVPISTALLPVSKSLGRNTPPIFTLFCETLLRPYHVVD